MKDAREYLKIERLRRGWTLQDASDRSRINITVLRALESGKTSELGSPLTVEALVSRYSAALGVETRQCEGLPLKAEKPRWEQGVAPHDVRAGYWRRSCRRLPGNCLQAPACRRPACRWSRVAGL